MAAGSVEGGRHLDEWAKETAPSTGLRRWYAHDPDKFVEFAARYRGELEEPPGREALQHLRALADEVPLTLVTATEDVGRSQVAVLAAILMDHENGSSGRWHRSWWAGSVAICGTRPASGSGRDWQEQQEDVRRAEEDRPAGGSGREEKQTSYGEQEQL